MGSRLLGISRLFRYEVRCWRDGILPDEEQAVGGPLRLSTDINRLAAVLDLVRRVPTPVWVATSSARVRCGTRTL